ncbi:hypothetical protein AB6A23_03045 [Paenibacillus tarimensis]
MEINGNSPNFGKFENESKEERERGYQQFQRRQERQYKIGKAIVFTIASIQIISAVISAFFEFRFLVLLIQVGLGIALFAGVAWVRYVFVCFGAVNLLLGFILLLGGYASEMTVGQIWLVVTLMVYAALASILLLKNSGVKEFLYSQKNG